MEGFDADIRIIDFCVRSKKYIILKLSSKSILNHDNNNEKVAGMPSDNKFNNSIIKWKNSLRNPYFH